MAIYSRMPEKLAALMSLPAENMIGQDIAEANLICALDLPGAENLQIQDSLTKLDNLAKFCRWNVDRHVYRFHRDPPHESYTTPARWRAAWLVQSIKIDYGAHYNPDRKRDKELGLPSDHSYSGDLFINGLLSPKRTGTCGSIPVLVVAIARRLGYPVHLACNRYHVYACWDDQKNAERFNIEACGPEGMTIHSDDYYRGYPHPMEDWEARPGIYLRPLTAAEETSMFLYHRVWCLEDNSRETDTLHFLTRMLQLAPDEPYYPSYAMGIFVRLMRARYRKLHPDIDMPDVPGDVNLAFDPREVLEPEERPWCLSITAHWHEKFEKIESARELYGMALAESGQNPLYRADLERFLRQHLLRGLGRKIYINDCPPQEEPFRLERLGNHLERAGRFLEARDALAEAWLLDAKRIAAFDHAKKIEQRPEYQQQIKIWEANRQRPQHAPPRTETVIINIKEN